MSNKNTIITQQQLRSWFIQHLIQGFEKAGLGRPGITTPLGPIWLRAIKLTTRVANSSGTSS
uniref:Uncharacterized protein n=1 Tax=Medicago truncatula TaxID=3880 RepID=I3SFK0_MEDTR|nr:unknown [Medicago truncatula]